MDRCCLLGNHGRCNSHRACQIQRGNRIHRPRPSLASKIQKSQRSRQLVCIMLLLFQLIFSLFSIFAIISVLSKKRSSLLSIGATVFWVIFCLLAAVFVWLPNALTVVANTFGIGRGTDLVLYVSLAIIFYVLFRLNVKLELMNRDITKVTREKTLSEVKKRDSSAPVGRSE